VQVGHRHVELGVLGVFQGEEFGRLIVDFQNRQAQITPDPVIDVHHWRAFAQLGEVLDHGIVVGVGTFFPATTLHHPLTEQRTLGHQRQRRVIEHQTLVERGNGDRQTVLARNEVRPAVDGFRPQLQTLQQLQQDFTTARGFGGEQHASGEFVEECRERRQRLRRLGFDRQVRQRLRREALATGPGFDVLLTGHYPWPALETGEAVFHRQEQFGGRQ